MNFPSLARAIAGTALACFFFAAPIEISAQPGNTSGPDFSGFTAAGSYLAARHAGLQRDALAAAGFYRDALRRDPRNGELLDRTFLSLLVGGDVEGSVKYAERVVQPDKTDRVSRLELGVGNIKRKRYVAARRDLASRLPRGWTCTARAGPSTAPHRRRHAPAEFRRIPAPCPSDARPFPNCETQTRTRDHATLRRDA